MIKKTKPTILLLINLLFLQGIYSQAPLNMKANLSQRFLNYCKAVPREEIFVHSDRDVYISGEDLWFNIYLIDRQSFKPSDNSRIVYVELLNEWNRPVFQKRILIDKGYGPGQIVLPDTLSSGIYTIRAYTSWMKNFLPYNCFMKDIEVYNTLRSKGFRGKEKAVSVAQIKKDDNIKTELKNSGTSFTINNSKKDTLELFIKSDKKFRTENDNHIVIFIQTHGNIDHISSENVDKDIQKILIPKISLTGGINQITIFDSRGKPVTERYIYTPVKYNNFLTLHSVDSCGFRSKIIISLESVTEEPELLNSTNLSISVAPGSGGLKTTAIQDYLVFGSEFGVLNNFFDGRVISDFRPGFIDSILMNVRSNWIDWSSILSDALPQLRYQMEKEDQILLGKLLTKDQQPVNSSEILLLCTPGKEASFQYTRTNNEGNFSFNVNIDEELKDLIIMPDNLGKDFKSIIESSYSGKYLRNDKLSDSSMNQVPAYISKLGVNYQVQKIYGTSALGGPLNHVSRPIKPVRFYGKPDIELMLADYISLPVMGEIFFELLPGVSMKKKKSGYEISITNYVGDKFSVLSPALMIDGVIIKDATLIANLDPEIVEKIDVIKGKYLVGKYFFPGIINVITKAGDFNCISIPDYMTRLSYRVLDPVRSFVSPDYSSEEMKENRIPDYRNTLYWNPSVKPDKDGRAEVDFWSSDNKSDYIINIQGITQEGKIFSLEKILKVK
jgi:hypothetical protein